MKRTKNGVGKWEKKRLKKENYTSLKFSTKVYLWLLFCFLNFLVGQSLKKEQPLFKDEESYYKALHGKDKEDWII